MPGEDHARLLVRARVARDHGPGPRLEVDLALGSGITAVTGPSGAGKTTLLLAIAGLVRPESGRIALDGIALFDGDAGVSVPAHRRRVALVFQSHALFPHLSAWRNVAYGLRRSARASRRVRAIAWLERTRVAHLADRLPASLSGGEAQRVALARALAAEPRALLLDEPFSALHPELRDELGAQLASLVAELEIPAILVTHHLEDATRLGSCVLEMDVGRIAGPSTC